MAIRPTRPTAPAQALRSNPATFSANAEASISYQWTALPAWIEGMGDYVDDRADAALAAALGGTLPPLTGQAGNSIVVNQAGTAVSFAPIAGRNRIINGQGRINQRGYTSGTATSGANKYTLDRWRVVTSGQSLTFTGDDSKRTMTAPAGGVEQVIEGANIEGGTYVLNWTGTATATVGGVARAKGETFTLAANTNATVRFSSGTFTDVQLEAGSVPTVFERLPLGRELALCQRYYWKTYSQGVTPGTVTTAGAVGAINVAPGSTYGALTSVYFPVDMRVAPSLTYFNPVTGVAGSWRADATDYAVGNAGIGISTRSAVIGNASVSIPAVGILLYGHIVADAEI